MPHHHNEGSLFNLALDILQGGSFVSLISEGQVFDGNGKAHVRTKNPKSEIV
jgi:hypothetical protein